jgi:hypothetical protein
MLCAAGNQQQGWEPKPTQPSAATATAASPTLAAPPRGATATHHRQTTYVAATGTYASGTPCMEEAQGTGRMGLHHSTPATPACPQTTQTRQAPTSAAEAAAAVAAAPVPTPASAAPSSPYHQHCPPSLYLKCLRAVSLPGQGLHSILTAPRHPTLTCPSVQITLQTQDLPGRQCPTQSQNPSPAELSSRQPQFLPPSHPTPQCPATDTPLAAKPPFAATTAPRTTATTTSVSDPKPSDDGHQVSESDGQRLSAVETGLVLLTEQVTALAQLVGMKGKAPSAPSGPASTSRPQPLLPKLSAAKEEALLRGHNRCLKCAWHPAGSKHTCDRSRNSLVHKKD